MDEKIKILVSDMGKNCLAHKNKLSEESLYEHSINTLIISNKLINYLK